MRTLKSFEKSRLKWSGTTVTLRVFDSVASRIIRPSGCLRQSISWRPKPLGSPSQAARIAIFLVPVHICVGFEMAACVGFAPTTFRSIPQPRDSSLLS